jgi:acyl transferase domain-containing protein
MQEQPSGSMLSVRQAAARVRERLSGRLCIATDNAPELCVVAGPTPEIEQLHAVLQQEGVASRLLHTSHAFHSSMMEPVADAFRALVAEIVLREPAQPFVSTATGTWITPEQATDPGYWARHLRLPVRFSEGVSVLLEERDLVLLEVGPRTSLTTFTRQHTMNRASQHCLSTLGDKDEQCWYSLLTAVGKLYGLGVSLDPDALHGPEHRQRVPLPTYPFERKRHWLDPQTPVEAREAAGAVPPPATAARVAPESPSAARVRPIIESQLALMNRQLQALEARRRQLRK